MKDKVTIKVADIIGSPLCISAASLPTKPLPVWGSSELGLDITLVDEF